MTREELGLIMLEREALWPHVPVKGEVEAAAWWDLLQDRPADYVSEALKARAKRGDKFPPSPGQIFAATSRPRNYVEALEHRLAYYAEQIEAGDHRFERPQRDAQRALNEYRAAQQQIPERTTDAA